ncbi:hypothetical protein IMY05_016G0024600 [Salix suchowensis]|nr:hypothetical protein IMY05_016G0024600 [Salix suchowensis]
MPPRQAVICCRSSLACLFAIHFVCSNSFWSIAKPVLHLLEPLHLFCQSFHAVLPRRTKLVKGWNYKTERGINILDQQAFYTFVCIFWMRIVEAG